MPVTHPARRRSHTPSPKPAGKPVLRLVVARRDGAPPVAIRPRGAMEWTVVRTVLRPGRSYRELTAALDGRRMTGFMALGDEAGRTDLAADAGKPLLCVPVRQHAGWVELRRIPRTPMFQIEKREYAATVLRYHRNGFTFMDLGNGCLADVRLVGLTQLKIGAVVRLQALHVPADPGHHPFFSGRQVLDGAE